MKCAGNITTTVLLLLGITFSTGCHDYLDPSFDLGNVSDEELDKAVHRELQEQHIAGFGLAVVIDGKTRYVRGYGHEDVQKNIPVDPLTTQFRWASMSKTVAGALVALEAAQGKVKIDDDIRGVYPRFPHSGVTLRRLMNHTAGILHYDNGSDDPVPSDRDVNDPQVNTGIEWAVTRWIDSPLLFTPGTDAAYSTFGINLAGVVLEYADAGRRSFWEQLRTEIAEPFGMEGLQPDYYWRKIPNRSKGYVLPSPDSDAVYEDPMTDVSWKLPGGGLTSTTLDAGRFCEGLLSSEYPQAARDLLWTDSTGGVHEDFRYGVGWFTKRKHPSDGAPDWTVAWHGGYQEKSEALFRVEVERRFCIIGFSNTRDGDDREGIVDLESLISIVRDLITEREEAGETPIQAEIKAGDVLSSVPDVIDPGGAISRSSAKR